MTKFETGSGNIYEDLGFEDANERALKAILARRINSILKHRHLTQAKSAKILNISQSKISCLKNGKLKVFSVEKLFSILVRLDRNVEIRISDRARPNANVKVVSGKDIEVAVAS